MLYPVEELAARSVLPLTLDLTWQPRSTGWAPASCLVQVCPTKDLAQPEAPVTLPCTNWTTTDGLKAHIANVAGYHEFDVTVWSQLATVRSSQSASVTARSLSLLPMSLAISRGGQLTSVWQRKVVEDSSERQADVVLRKLDGVTPSSPSVQALALALAAARRSAAGDSGTMPAPPAAETETRLDSDEVQRQDALDIRWSGLELGATYMMALFDVGANDTADFIMFSAVPTCMDGEYQLDAFCFWPSREAASYRQGPAQCEASGDSSGASSSLRSQPWMASISNAKEYWLVKNLSIWLDSSLWVGRKDKRRRRRDLAELQSSYLSDGDLAELQSSYLSDGGLAELQSSYLSDGDLAELQSSPDLPNGDLAELQSSYLSDGDPAKLQSSPDLPNGDLAAIQSSYLSDGDLAKLQSSPDLPNGDLAALQSSSLSDGELPFTPHAPHPHAELVSVRATRRPASPLLSDLLAANPNVELLPKPSTAVELQTKRMASVEDGLSEFGSEQDGAGPEKQQPKPCTFVQKGRKGIQASTGRCDDQLHVICSTNLSVTVPLFRERDIWIDPRSTSIRLDWRVQDSWATTYLVTVCQRSPPTTPAQASPAEEPDARIKRRAAASTTYTAPPVVLTNLEENAVYELTIVRRSAGQQTMVGPIAIRALDPPHQASMFPADDLPRMFLSMSYIVVIVTAIIITIVLLVGRVPTLDCICQISLAVTLAVGFLILLLSHGGPLAGARSVGCRAAAAVTHLAFSAALVAVALLALVLPHLLRAARAAWLDRHAWTVPLLVAGPHTMVVMVTVAKAKRQYVDGAPQTCWLDLDTASPVLWVVVAHLLLAWLPGLLLAFRALALGSTRLPPTPHHPAKLRRQNALLRLRFTALALLLLLPACWSLGVTAAFYQDRPLVIAQAVLNTLLAVALGLLCADTFVAGARPGQRVGPDTPQKTAHPPQGEMTLRATGGGDLLVKRTFHFAGDSAAADRTALFAVPTPG